MKKMILISFLLCLIFTSCKDYNEVRIMPEFNNSEAEVTLYKNLGSSVTVVINTTADDITAEYDVSWLSVDVNKRRVIYSVAEVNETGEPRTTVVKLHSGEWLSEVTVTQREIDESQVKLLKVGDLTEDGLGMIFWVDPENPEVGKAISLKRKNGACEKPYKMNNAFSTVNGVENTALFLVNAGPDDAVTFCTGLGEGWYMPASGELGDLFDAYNGISHTDPSFVANNVENLTDTEKSARSLFDKMLTDLGGDPINATETGAGESYWSSTEVAGSTDGKNVTYVRLGKYLSQGGSKESTRYARAMKLVGNYKFPEEPANISVSPSSVELSSEVGATAEVTVTTNKDTYTYSVEGEDVSWLKHEQNGEKVVFTALSTNTSGAERTAKVVFTTGEGDNQATAEVTVTQEKQPVASDFTIGEYVNMDNGVQLDEGGIVFWAEGNTAKILAMKQIEPLGWVDDEQYKAVAVGCTDKNDGYVNTEKMKGCAFSSAIPVLQYCTDGWYIPSINEMNDVFEAYNGGKASASGLDPSQITPEEKEARAAWDKLFTDRGGDVMSSDPAVAHWTSTEDFDPSKAFFMRFGKWESDKVGSKYMKEPTRYWRLIRKVSK